MPISKTALTDAVLAAMAEGALVDPAAAAAAEAAAVADAAKATAEKEAADKAAAEAAAAAAVGGGSGDVPAVDAGVVSFLKTELSAAQASVASLNVKVAALEGASTKSTETVSAMRAIVVASVENMSVALGQSKDVVAGLDDSALLARHTALRDSFTSKFKAHGVAAVSAQDTDPSKTATPFDAKQAARVNAARIK